MSKFKIPDFNWKKWLLAFLFAASLLLVYKGFDDYAAAGLAGVGLFIQNLLALLSPLVSGLLLAYLLHIPCRGIEKLLTKIPPRLLTKRPHPDRIKASSTRKIPEILLYFVKKILHYVRNALVIPLRFLTKHSRPLSVLCLGLITIGLIVGASSFIIPAVQKSISDLVENWPYLTSTAQAYIENLLAHPLLDQDWETLLEPATKFLTEQLDFSKLGIWAASWATDMAKSVFNFIISSVVAIYILLNPAPFFKSVKRIARIFTKDELLKATTKYINRFNAIFSKFITCQILDSLIVGTIGGIGLTIFGVRYAPLLAVIIAVLNIIPYIGSITSVTICCLTTLLTGGLTVQFWEVLIFLIILQQVDGNIISPRLLGQSLNLNPVVIIFAIILGGAYYGILGMFLSVPVMAIFKIILGDILRFLEERKKKKQGNSDNPDNPEIEGDTKPETKMD
ncbi:MAG: AI-2E family transporter [Peptococcaceae bacterium]|nr:AI-2E family transporter [Peptococcaceae bacterium]